MKALRKIGCWTVLVLFVTAGTLVFLFSSSRQERSDFSGRPIRGNVVILGGDVEISSDEYVRGNLLVVGDDLTLEGQIGGNLVVIGGDADLTGHAQVGGNVSVVGGDAEAGGSSVVGGNVAVVGGDVELAGHSRVGGNVRVVGGRIERGPDAHVAGNSSWRVYTNSVAHPDLYSAAPAPLALTDPPRQPDPAVSVVVETGGPEERGQSQSQRRQRAVEELAEAAEEAAEELAEAAEAAAEAAEAAAEEAAKAAREQSEMQREAALEAGAAARAQAAANRTPWFLVFLGKLVRAFLWTLLITALVLLFAWLLPKQVKAISETAEKETALSFAAGAIGIMGAALLAAILTITVCFALLALPILALLALVLLCGWTVTCYWLGRQLDALVAGPGSASWNPLISVGLSSLVVTGVAAFAWVIFPCLGFIFALLIGSTGTGAVIVHVARGSGRLPRGVLGGVPGAPAPGGEEAGQGGINSSGSTAESFELPESVLVEMQSDEGNPLYLDSSESRAASGDPESERHELTDFSPVDTSADTLSDDLTRIAGIGPTYAERLRNAGIATFSQMAVLEAEEIAAVLGCPAARVERGRLREQAAELAGPQ